MTLFRKSALLKVGLFDTNNITEDLEIAWRLRKNGYHITYAHSAEVYTEVPETIQSLWRQRTRWYRGKLANMIKHRDMLMNPKYGHFGTFVLPFSLASEVAALATIYFIVYYVLFTLYWNLQIVLAYLAANSLSLTNLMTGMFGSTAGIAMFLVMVLPWIFAIFISHKLGNKKLQLSDAPVLAFFMFFYSIILSAIYVYSVYKEIYGSDYRW
jgi:cellulose synthase/poly-beta-1,6-N-acetylglucosamine synthase-like glycosyltransferase